MNKFNDDDFNISEYERKSERRNKRLMASLAIRATVAFIGMVIFWK